MSNVIKDVSILTSIPEKTLNKLNGFYKNWCDEWFQAGELLEKLKKEK